jgi:hypothetical protein
MMTSVRSITLKQAESNLERATDGNGGYGSFDLLKINLAADWRINYERAYSPGKGCDELHVVTDRQDFQRDAAWAI